MDDDRGLLARLGRRLRGRPDEPVPASYDAPPPELETRLVRVWWEDGHTLALTGWVYLNGTSVSAEDRPALGLRLEGADHGVEVEATIAPVVDPAVDEAAGDARNTYAAAAFEAWLDLRPLFARRTGPWTLVASIDTEDGPVTVPFATRDPHGSAGMLVDSAAVSGHVVRPEWSPDNGLVLALDDATPDLATGTRATWVEVEPDRVLVVTGETDLPELSLELRSPHQVVAAPAVVTDGRFTASVPLRSSDWYDVERPLRSGLWFLHAVDADGGSSEVALAPEALPGIGELREGVEQHVRVERTVRDTVRVTLSPPLRGDERGAFAQMVLRREYHAMPPVTDRSTAFHECYYGVSCTDSARAIREELVRRDAPMRHVWGVADLSVPVPDGDGTVLRHSREWWQTLGSAAYLTFNAGLPAGLVRRSGQVLVQTWHGTPLKLLGADRPVNEGKEGFAESTARYVSRWDHLLAPNPWSAEVFRRAWLYDGSVLELGYPRNDALAGVPDADAVAAIRARLGVADDVRLVLHAPTWRDGQKTMPDLLDLDRLAELVPDTVFLVRGHMNATRWQRRPTGARVLDVTTYPEIDDLFLVADVLVTDYSSVMFDFSVTGKPMVFHVPDLEDYRDRRRGVYFDLAESAPGPLVTTTEEVADFLTSYDVVAHDERFGPAYDAWRARFNPRDDGHAAARVVDAVYLT